MSAVHRNAIRDFFGAIPGRYRARHIAARLNMRVNIVSQHLRALERRGIVVSSIVPVGDGVEPIRIWRAATPRERVLHWLQRNEGQHWASSIADSLSFADRRHDQIKTRAVAAVLRALVKSGHVETCECEGAPNLYWEKDFKNS